MPDAVTIAPEDASEIASFLRGRTLFVTGATGFLAKVMIEKILREQPDVRRIYLLVRGGSQERAEQRLGDVIESPVFDRVRSAQGSSYESFMRDKLRAVDGRLDAEGLGIGAETMEELRREVDVVVNSAATTTFDERYDMAIQINTLGAARCLELAKQCPKLRVLVHVSTAFTNGTREGYTKEMPFEHGVPLKSELSTSSGALDVEGEIARALGMGEEVRTRLEARGLSGDALDSAAGEELRQRGMRISQRHGWQDTYVFTKAMGEMLVSRGAAEHNIPCCIVRPSIVESALKEPHPGWVEGIRMADPILLAFGKGQMAGFSADPDGVLDVVPVDFVINAVLAAMVRHARGFGEKPFEVYHVATSTANPLSIQQFVEASSRHFQRTPFLDRKGEPIKVKRMAVFPTAEAFRWYAFCTYLLPATLAELR